jgi:hypothetical protein
VEVYLQTKQMCPALPLLAEGRRLALADGFHQLAREVLGISVKRLILIIAVSSAMKWPAKVAPRIVLPLSHLHLVP